MSVLESGQRGSTAPASNIQHLKTDAEACEMLSTSTQVDCTRTASVFQLCSIRAGARTQQTELAGQELIQRWAVSAHRVFINVEHVFIDNSKHDYPVSYDEITFW